MEEQNSALFPYEFELITPETQKYVDKVFGFTQSIYRLCRVGPKRYVVCERYKIDAANIYNMPLRPTDIFIGSFQRSGTTLTQELVWLLANNLDYTRAAEVPLANRYAFLDHFMFFDTNQLDALVEYVDSNMDQQKVKEMFMTLSVPESKKAALIPETVPRFIKTHLPMSLLNPKLLDTAKMVYVARDPRDVAVSCYHQGKLFKILRYPGGFKDFWNLFYKGLSFFSPIFQHIIEAWNLRHHPNMLFLFYEDLVKDLPASIRRVADFLGKDLNQEEMDRLCDHLSIKNFKNNKSVNFEELRVLGMLATDTTFVRKGKVGGWRDYFDEEMTLQAEQWITDNLRNTDLRFPQADNK